MIWNTFSEKNAQRNTKAKYSTKLAHKNAKFHLLHFHSCFAHAKNLTAQCAKTPFVLLVSNNVEKFVTVLLMLYVLHNLVINTTFVLYQYNYNNQTIYCFSYHMSWNSVLICTINFCADFNVVDVTDKLKSSPQTRDARSRWKLQSDEKVGYMILNIVDIRCWS